MTLMSTHPLKKVPAKVGTILSESEFDTLHKMLGSSDEGDHRMAQAILNQCDIQKSIYWIWRLARHNASRMVYLRTKASREFQKESNLFTISWTKPTMFALHLAEKKWLTTEIYQFLKQDILKELTERNTMSNFYEIHVVIKDHYREFDPESTLTHLPTKP